MLTHGVPLRKLPSTSRVSKMRRAIICRSALSELFGPQTFPSLYAQRQEQGGPGFGQAPVIQINAGTDSQRSSHVAPRFRAREAAYSETRMTLMGVGRLFIVI